MKRPDAIENVLIRPRITEKGTLLGEAANAYSFDVSPKANKALVAKAVKAVYGVVPVKINIIVMPTKKIAPRGIVGTKGGGKKAIVYLKKGDKIEFV